MKQFILDWAKLFRQYPAKKFDTKARMKSKPTQKYANDLLETKQFMEFEINWEFQSNDFCKITVENDEFLVMKISNSRQINGRIAFVSIR